MRNKYTLISFLLLAIVCIMTVLIAPTFNYCGTPNVENVYAQAERNKLSEKVQKNTVSIFSMGSGYGFCSGVIVAEDKEYTYVLTCKHCIGVTEEVIVENNKAETVIARMDEDLALVIVKGSIEGKETAVLSRVKPVQNEELIHIGYPSFDLYESWGKVLRTSKDWQWATFNSIGGCSGGGVYNLEGELVGILWGGFPYKPVSIYEPIDDIRVFMLRINKYINIK